VISTLIGKKIGMTQVFNSDGDAVPVTAIEVNDMLVFDKRTEEKDGYNALRVGCGEVNKPKRISKAVKGHFKNDKKGVDLPLKKTLKEIRVDKAELENYKIGDVITVESFKDVKFVDVSGVTKGKGFQGVFKRWNFHGGGNSHGSMSHRKAGSIGSSTFPARVFKGHKMEGHLGVENVTTMNLKVERIIPEDKIMLIRGSVPGANNGLVLIVKAKKKK
jgi:large subunit ribosomal protein L3